MLGVIGGVYKFEGPRNTNWRKVAPPFGQPSFTENKSAYTRLSTRHRLENSADEPLYLIEVLSDSYLEDGIVRVDDRYKRDA